MLPTSEKCLMDYIFIDCFGVDAFFSKWNFSNQTTHYQMTQVLYLDHTMTAEEGVFAEEGCRILSKALTKSY